MNLRRQAIGLLLILTGIAALIYACGPDITFRAYLDKRFWRPTVRPISDLAKDLPPEKATFVPYAGMGSNGGNAALTALRDRYAGLFSNLGPDNKLEWPS